MAGFKGKGKEGVTASSARQSRPPTRLPMLPLLFLGAAATTMWLVCHGAEVPATELTSSLLRDGVAQTDVSSSEGSAEETARGTEAPLRGFEVPPSALEEVKYPPQYEGSWLIVKVERPGRMGKWRKKVTKPARVKKMSGSKLKVFEMKCFALEKPRKKQEFARDNTDSEKKDLFEARMKECSKAILKFKQAARIQPVRFTYVLPEKYGKWISTHALEYFRESLKWFPYATMTFFYNCQLPGDEEAATTMCHRRSNSEFHPGVVHQYESNTMTVKYKGEGEKPRGPSLARSEGNVTVSAMGDTILQKVIHEGETTHLKELDRGDNGPAAIRTDGLSRPQIRLSTGWEAFFGEMQLGSKNAGSTAFWIQRRGQGTPAVQYRVPFEMQVMFTVSPFPEIYVHPRTEVPKDFGSSGARNDPNRTIHIRLQKKSIVGPPWRRELGSQTVVFSCGTRAQAVAECLKSNSWLWNAKPAQGIFLSSGKLKELKTFVMEAVGEKNDQTFTKMGLPAPENWTYVLEGRLTGKVKLFQKRVETTALGEEEVREMVMSGVTESRVLKTKFVTPLNGSYARVLAAVPEVSAGNEETNKFSCPGGLLVTFEPQTRTVYYQSEKTGEWKQLRYRNAGNEASPVDMKIGVMERFIYYKGTKQQQAIPVEWTKIKIEGDVSKKPLFKKVKCFGQLKALDKELKTTPSLIVTWEKELKLFSPRVVDNNV